MTRKAKRSAKTEKPNSPDKEKSGFGKWVAGILGAVLGGLIIYVIENYKRPIMEVSLNFGDSKYWESSPFRTTPPPTTLISGWSTLPDEPFHVRMRNVGDIPLFDCQPLASSRPIVNDVPAQESLPFNGDSVTLNPKDMREWDNMKMRFYTDANKYQVTIICSCSYYDLFHIKREVKYVESGIKDYARPTLKALQTFVEDSVHDKDVASPLLAKIYKAQNSGIDDQIKILLDLQKDVHGMEPFFQHTLGEYIAVVLSDTQTLQMRQQDKAQRLPDDLRPSTYTH